MMILLRLLNVVKILVTSRVASFSLSFRSKLTFAQIFSFFFVLEKVLKNFTIFEGDFFGPEGMGRDIIRGGGKTSKIV